MQSGESKWTAGIRDQVKRMTDLTGALVSLARMDEAGGALELSDVDLSAIIEETLKPFLLVAEQQGKSLVSAISPGVTVKGSDAALRQLVSILADNAVKYSSEGAEIRFSLGTGGKHAVLTASNPAEGLKPGNREELFDRFYRGDSSRSSEKRGYGIGLSMARAICEAFGGTISAQSPDGSGLVIKASFPLA